MNQDDIIVGTIQVIREPIDRMQRELVCDTGTYTMSLRWVEKNQPKPGMMLVLDYSGYYHSYPILNGQVQRPH